GMPAVNEITMAQNAEAHEKDADGTKDEHRRLKHGGIHDHAHAAENRVKASGKSQAQGNGPKDVDLVSEDVNVIHVQQRADDDVAGINRGGNLGEHQARHGEQAQNIA